MTNPQAMSVNSNGDRPHWRMQNDVHQLTETAHCRDKQTQTQAAAQIIVYDKIRSVEVRFTQAARKHRIGKGRALAAMDAAGKPLVVPATDNETDDRLVFIGYDDRNVELEVIAEIGRASGRERG